MLTPDAFAKLLKWLVEVRRCREIANSVELHSPISDDEMAGEEYEKIRAKLISYFARRGCLTPLEMADETITRVAGRVVADESITQSEPEPARFFYNTARYIFLEYLRKREREQPILDNLPPSLHPSVDPSELADLEMERISLERRIRCLDCCKSHLPPGNWELIIEYYQGEKRKKIENRRYLATKLNLTPNALSIRVHRIRKQLEVCVNNCINN